MKPHKRPDPPMSRVVTNVFLRPFPFQITERSLFPGMFPILDFLFILKVIFWRSVGCFGAEGAHIWKVLEHFGPERNQKCLLGNFSSKFKKNASGAVSINYYF